MTLRLVIAAALCASFAIAADTAHGIDKSAMDTAVKPGDDFHAYANGDRENPGRPVILGRGGCAGRC